MDLGALDLHAGFWAGLGSIVVIDLILAGDNAVVIAMAVRNLPAAQRRKGILLGAGAAVLLRVAVTFFVAQLLSLPFVKLVGGLLIVWVALKLFGGEDDGRRSERKAGSVWEAVKLIVVADITMSVDNMLAVGGASHGNLFLLLFGLGLSIPFIVFASEMLSQLMGRFPIILYAGAAVLGRVSAEMVLTDPFVVSGLGSSHTLLYAGEAAMAAAIVAYGWLRSRRAPEPVPVAEPAAEPPAESALDR